MNFMLIIFGRLVINLNAVEVTVGLISENINYLDVLEN
jgi:hypothetical protein